MAEGPEARAPRLRAEELLRALVDGGVDFVVIGGFSLAAHGVIRATKDVDIAPAPDAPNLGQLADVLARLDAEILLADDFDPAELGIEPDAEGLAFGGNRVLRTTLGRLDVLQEIAGVNGYEQLARGAVTHDVQGAGMVRFAGLDDLVAMKAAAGRPQDLIDISSLERSREP